ncbi:MAG: glycogen debranching protein, partial [Nocardioidaceae bacterium]
YRIKSDDPRYYMDYTGTGNSLNVRNPHTLQLIMDSLRYWVTEMHVDGFRFDLAAALAREFYDVDRLATFFDLVQQDPVVSQVKLIAEPWDLGAGGYQVGNFPPLWTEWNGKYRDTVRDYWRGAPATLGEFASRLSGSSDLYQQDGRKPIASINFVTAHDGFTMRDLVSYDHKHNKANGEKGHDGTDDNRSWNCGVEGQTKDSTVLALRARQQRNFLITLLLSQGVPMLLHGDEVGRSQGGNNNVYCQDNETSWMPWELADWQQGLLEFSSRLIALRREHPVLHRRRFFAGLVDGAHDDVPDIAWFSPDGTNMKDADWGHASANVLMVFLNGAAIPEPDRHGEPIVDDSFLVAFNASDQEVTFTVPDEVYGEGWQFALDTHDDVAGSASVFDDAMPLLPGVEIRVADRSVVVLRRPHNGV